MYSVVHFGHLLTFICSNFTQNGKRLKQAVSSEGENSLEPFSKELKVVLLYPIKTVVSHLNTDTEWTEQSDRIRKVSVV